VDLSSSIKIYLLELFLFHEMYVILNNNEFSIG
jgi:hypothetical protein